MSFKKIQYDTIEELTLELVLYPNRKKDIIEDCAYQSDDGWVTLAKDGNFGLFNRDLELDDISNIKYINGNIIPKNQEVVNLPPNLKVIGDYAFSSCKNLKEIYIPQHVETIGSYAFAHTEISSIELPASVTYICAFAFYDSHIQYASLSECQLKKFYRDTFHRCSQLRKIELPRCLAYIASSTFDNCENLVEIDLPDTVNHIGSFAFYYCKSLEKLVLPESIREIEADAFVGCLSLKELRFKGKTIDEVYHMRKYPWGIRAESIIKCEGE